MQEPLFIVEVDPFLAPALLDLQQREDPAMQRMERMDDANGLRSIVAFGCG